MTRCQQFHIRSHTRHSGDVLNLCRSKIRSGAGVELFNLVWRNPNVRPSVCKLMRQLFAKWFRRRPRHRAVSDAKLNTEVGKVALIESAILNLGAKDLEYQTFDSKGKRINPDRVTHW